VSGLYPPSGILGRAGHSVSGAGSASVVGWGDAHALLGPNEVTEVSCYLRDTTEFVGHSPRLTAREGPVSETVFFLVLGIKDNGRSPEAQ
jgi:hypothetical protein